MADDEILYRAEVEDLTKEFFEKFDQNIDKLSNKASEGFSNVEGTIKGVGNTMAIVGGIVAGLTEELVKYSLEMSKKLLDFLEDSERVAEGVEGIGVSLKVVGENSGYSMLALKELTEQLDKIGLSTSDSRKELLKMIQSELDLKDSSALAQVAVDAAAIGNVTSLQALERIIQSITYQSPRMLKSLGMVVDFQSDIKKASENLGRELTDTEKKQVSLNSVLEQGRKIAGAYAESLTTAAGQRKLQADLIDKIREEAGNIFTQASYEQLKAANEMLQKLFDYLKDHRKDLSVLSDDFAAMVKSVLKVSETLLQLAGTVAKLNPLIKAVQELREELGMSSDVMDIFLDGLTAGTQVIAMAVGGFTKMFTMLEHIPELIDKFAKYRTSQLSLDEYKKYYTNLFKEIDDAGNKAFLSVSQPLIEEKTNLDNVTEATNNAAEAAENLAKINSEKLAKAVDDANTQLKKLKDSQEEAASDRAIKAQRDEIEQELQLQWAREDQERRYTETIKEILQNAEDQKTELVKQAADNRLEIEVDYRRRLQELLDDYNREASELARKRDAVGMLALARKYKSDLEKEKKSYSERKEEAEKSYRESMEALDKSTQKQLEKAEQARQKELVEYQRNLDRQAELKRLHDQWEQEDRDRQLQKALQDLANGFVSMDGMTKEGLDSLLTRWGNYFTNLNEIIAAGVANANSLYSQLDMGGNVTFSDPYGGGAPFDSNSRSMNKGQSGLVSDLLTPGNIGNVDNAFKIGQTPYVTPSRVGYERRDINVKVDGNALTPHIQRVLVKSLEEIERNRG